MKTTTKAKQIREKFLKKSGQICTITYKKQLKTNARNNTRLVEKVTTCQARAGIEYDNIEEVVQNRATGLAPKENKGLPYGKWVKYPYILEHNNNEYYRFTVLNNNVVPKSEYFIDNKPATFDEVKQLCIPSQFKVEQKSAIFNLPANSIIDLK